jgi:hypothetical protein
MWLLRMLGIGLGMLLAAGFGICGAYSVMAGVSAAIQGLAGGASLIFLFFGLLGLAIGWTLARAVWFVFKEKTDAERPPEQGLQRKHVVPAKAGIHAERPDLKL